MGRVPVATGTIPMNSIAAAELPIICTAMMDEAVVLTIDNAN